MEITLEQAERVRQYAKVSYEEARAALEQTGGSCLDAVIWLERQGRTPPVRGGSWSTRYGGPQPEESMPAAPSGVSAAGQGPRHRRYTAKEVGEALKSFLRNCTKISVDIWRKDDLLVGIPLVVCVLLFIVAYQLMIPLAILGLLLRCRYHISGWDWNTEAINHTMDQVTDTVAGWTDRARAEWSGRHRHNK